VSAVTHLLDFTVNPATVQITDDPNVNTLALTLTNTSGGPLSLKGGTPVPETAQPSGPSSVYLRAAGLLTNAQCAVISIQASGWTTAYFTNVGASWALCPASDLTLAAKEQVVFTITKVTVAGPARPTQLVIDYYLPGPKSDSKTLALLVQGPPGPAPSIGCAVLPNVVYTTLDEGDPIENTLFLVLSNTAQTPLAKSWPAANPPKFILSFVCAPPPGYGALTTAALAKVATIEVAEQYLGDWTIEQMSDLPNPYWVLRPTPANQQILGIDAAANVELVISRLVSELPVKTPDPTLLTVQLVDIPNYNDSQVTALLIKELGPSINLFYADPGTAAFHSSSGTTTLHWAAANAQTVTFDAEPLKGQIFAPVGALPSPIAIQAGEKITMTAHLPVATRRGDVPSEHEVTVMRTLELGSTTRTSVALPSMNGPAAILFPGTRTAFVFDGIFTLGHKGEPTMMAMVDRSTGAVAYTDLATVVGTSHGNPNVILAVCASPDESMLYVLVGTDEGTVFLLSIDAVTGSAQIRANLGVLGKLALIFGLQPTPDGRLLYLSFQALDFNNKEPYGAGGFWVIETQDYTVQKRYPWPPNEAVAIIFGGVIGTSPDGTKAYVAGGGGLVVFDVAHGFVPVSSILLFWELHEVCAFLGLLAVTGPDRLRVCGVAITEGSKQASQESKEALAQLVVIEVDPASSALKVAEVHPFIMQEVPALSFDASGTHLYVSLIDRLLRYDSNKQILQSLACGSGGDFLAWPIAASPQDDDVVYAVSNYNFMTVRFTGISTGRHTAVDPH
jgi:hypothetical protein